MGLNLTFNANAHNALHDLHLLRGCVHKTPLSKFLKKETVMEMAASRKMLPLLLLCIFVQIWLCFRK
jgi:hypothetical protein